MVKIGLAVAKQVGRPQDASAGAGEELVRGRSKYGQTDRQRTAMAAGLNALRPGRPSPPPRWLWVLLVATRLRQRHSAMAAGLKLLCVFAIVDRNRLALADTGPHLL